MLPLLLPPLLFGAAVMSSSALLPVMRRSTNASLPLSSPSSSCCSLVWLQATDHMGAWVDILWTHTPKQQHK